MRFTNMRLKWAGVTLALATGVTGGCTTPPSVAPLLRVVNQALQQEASYLQAEETREMQRLAQARAAIEAGFVADLNQQAQPDKPWILDAARAYTAACEELVRQDATLHKELAQRADNLQAATTAQQRALNILEQQDALLTQTLNGNPWQIARNILNTK